jgi:Xaa-Pro aminopeptidase
VESIGSLFTENITEDDLASEIDYHLHLYGASQPAFKTIASF